MATSSKQSADLLREMLNKSGSDVLTLRWGEFYDTVRRERMSEAFMGDLVQKSKEVGLNIAFGNATVLIAKDYPFNPKK